MPVGAVVATLVTQETGEYVALSRPVVVESATKVAIRPVPPIKTETDLLVRLQREKYLQAHGQSEVDIIVRGEGGEPRSPDVLIAPADRIYAIWYGLADKRVALEVSSKSVFLPSETIVLRPGRVESHSSVLRALPDIEARIRLPASLSAEEMKLELRIDRPGQISIREEVLAAGTESVKLDNVPAERLDVVLHVPPWIFHQPTDVSDGQDATVHFDPKPITITGTVFRGEREHAASLEFQTTRGGDTLQVSTDERGAYEAALFRAGSYVVKVKLDNVEGPAHVELLEQLIREDTTLDFHIPHTDFVVRVVDHSTQEGIHNAKLMVGNRFLSRAGLQRGEKKERAATQRITTDEEGYGALPPLHPGTLTLIAEAEGYLPSETYQEKVDEWVREKEIQIELRAVDATEELRLLLPTGEPAANAEVRIQKSLDNGPPIWSGKADARGVVQLPSHEGEILVLVRHPRAGFLVRREVSFDGGPTWSLPPLGEPLSVVAKRPWNEPARQAQFALWVEGQFLAGDVLRWLSGADPGADRDGFWRAPNVPSTSLKLLAWSWSSTESVNAVELESLATVIPYPRTGPVEVETLN